MIRLPIFATIFLILVAPNVFALQGGSLAPASQRQGIVGISINGEITNCIGVLLEATRVLTSASCTQDFLSNATPANQFRVHPLQGTRIGNVGGFGFPILNEQDTPFVGVSQVNIHPQNTSEVGNFNLSILRLSTPLNGPFVTLYNGNRNLAGERGIVFGWDDGGNDFTNGAVQNFYEANVLGLPPIVEGTDFSSTNTDCLDGTPDTNTLFCAGFRNETRFTELVDVGAPLYLEVDGQQTVAGILSFASNGFEFQGEIIFEEFANVSSMQDFILDNAPNAQFVFERNPTVIAPLLLLLDDE